MLSSIGKPLEELVKIFSFFKFERLINMVSPGVIRSRFNGQDIKFSMVIETYKKMKLEK
jgi:hypothetical protein